MSLPRKSFARKIIRMKGYTTEEEITEVACLDKVSREEAAQRIELARAESKNRSVAQYLRQCKARDRVEQADASYGWPTTMEASCVPSTWRTLPALPNGSHPAAAIRSGTPAAPSASFAARTSEKAACRSSEMRTTALSATP